MSLARQIKRNYHAHISTVAREAAKRQGVPWCNKCKLPAMDAIDMSYDQRKRMKIHKQVTKRGQLWRCIKCSTWWMNKEANFGNPDTAEGDRSTSDDRQRSEQARHSESESRTLRTNGDQTDNQTGEGAQ